MEPLIEINQGKLLGTKSKDIDGNPFYSFKGIPYAESPVGKLRFKAPQDPSPWNGIFHATKNGNPCPSVDLFKKEMIGSEDCLNLNVYTSSLPSSNSLLVPVMVFIHGGSFRAGSNTSEIYGPEFLMTEKIIVITINYRLGLLGFLSMNDPKTGVPGNAGFKDMIMALKWVKTNVKKFNGDPENVTIFGESAGGVAVHLLMLSPMGRGLFHKAISQSGCALNPWSRAKKIDEEIYNVFDYTERNEIEFLEYLQNLPVKDLLWNQAKINTFIGPSFVGFDGLVIENDCDTQGEIPFMVEEPIDLILRGDFARVPFVIGFTNMEGLVVNTYNEKRVIDMLNNFETNIPHFLGYRRGSEESLIVAQKIKTFYFENKEHDEIQDQFYEMATDHLFKYGLYTAVWMHSLYSPVYFYRMSIKTSLQFLQPLMKKDQHKGAAHGDDIAYLFKTKFTPELSPDSLEYKSVKMFVKLWTNFACCGNPTSDDSSTVIWKKATMEKIGFLDINKELIFYENFYDASIKFWNHIYKNSPSGQKFAELNSKM